MPYWKECSRGISAKPRRVKWWTLTWRSKPLPPFPHHNPRWCQIPFPRKEEDEEWWMNSRPETMIRNLFKINYAREPLLRTSLPQDDNPILGRMVDRNATEFRENYQRWTFVGLHCLTLRTSAQESFLKLFVFSLLSSSLLNLTWKHGQQRSQTVKF